MRKVIFFILTLIISCMNVNAQKIHKILFGHTTDRNIGQSVEVDMDRASCEIDQIGGDLNYEVVSYIYPGDKCSKENLREVLNGISPKYEDIVIFYYSGHGARAASDISIFPQLALNITNEDNLVPLEEVRSALIKTQAHLSIVICDCSNYIDEHVASKSNALKLPKDSISDIALEWPTSKSVLSATEDDANHYGPFFANKTIITASASDVGELAMCDIADGGFFSRVFFEGLWLSKRGTPWGVFLQNVKEKVIDLTTEKVKQGTLKNVQTPIYSIEIF